MPKRKKPTNKELLDMLLYLRKMIDNITKLSQDTAFIFRTYVSMKNEDDALFREIRKRHESEIKNTTVKQNVESTLKGVKHGKKETGQADQASKENR